MSPDTAKTIRLSDYQPFDWEVTDVRLTFRLDETNTRVVSRISFSPRLGEKPKTLRLDGEALKLHWARLNGKIVEPKVTETGLTLDVPEGPIVWEAEVEISPATNTVLEGLYLSRGIFCTQCEAEGFRRITYFPDRPDVMAPYSVRIEADAPVLLSNGNLVAEGPGWAEWHDPWPKPSYLFALVAGDLKSVSGSYKTIEDRDVTLNVWVRSGDEDRCDYALDSLIRAMEWDEKVYGRAYDLDVFNLVAVDDFNAGAMENKGLNIFNSKYVLASPTTATDADYEAIESVVAHEYFHNWTGNRITCRDWFQLCLKEGLTVFRDQEFTADMRSRSVKRIADALLLRAAQFREDQGPLAHPARPEEYIEINNFYTVTVYEKGAEIVRMLHTLLGDTGFAEALDLYFQRHDGRAATVEEFFECFVAVGGADLKGFDLWWRQAGTPHISIEESWDGAVLTLDIRQTTAPTPGQSEKSPQIVPLRAGVIDAAGRAIGDEHLIVLRDEQETWAVDASTGLWKRSNDTPEAVTASSTTAPKPTLSINRGFSAPVIVASAPNLNESRHLLAFDSDPFNRWDAGRRLIKDGLTRLILNGTPPAQETLDAFAKVLTDESLDPAFQALLLRLPSDDDLAGTLAEGRLTPDPDAIHRGKKTFSAALATRLHGDLQSAYERLALGAPYVPDAEGSGRRALRMTALGLLATIEGADRASRLYNDADNMTERLAALAVLLDHGAAKEAVEDFYKTWHKTSGVLDKWFGMQVSYAAPNKAVDIAERLTHHPDFDWQVPNRVRSVFGALLRNHAGFHRADGQGYAALARWIRRLDPINPQIAAGLTSGFQTWARYDADRQSMMRDALNTIASLKDLSRDTTEMVSRLTKT